MKPYKLYGIKVITALLAVMGINFLAGFFHIRTDVTQNQRYSLSETAKTVVKKIDTACVVNVLLGGNLPPDFKKLRSETRRFIDEWHFLNPHITYHEVNLLEDEATRDNAIQELTRLGLTPTTLTHKKGAGVSQELVFPWALATYRGKTVRIPLLRDRMGVTVPDRIAQSVENLEYAFTDALLKLTTSEKKKVAVLKGNGELPDVQIADFLTTLKDYYRIAPFTLDSIAGRPIKTLGELQEYQLAIVAKPTEPFTDAEKYALDQYALNGGKILWLIDQVAMDMEDMHSVAGTAIAVARDLNVNDLFFKYGIRIHASLVADLYCTQLVLAAGTDNATKYHSVPWTYAPMVFSRNNHLVNTHVDALRFQFANAIDTLSNSIRKTVLLSSSPLSKIVRTPVEISLQLGKEQPNESEYRQGPIPLAVLLEGRFASVYKNRVTPFSLPGAREEGAETSIIIISDGDLIKNEVRNGQPLTLGYDKWTNAFYGNKEFLLNCVQYLLDDTGVMNIRSKEWEPAFLDPEKIIRQKKRWQLLNIAAPLALFALLGGFFYLYRKKKYARPC